MSHPEDRCERCRGPNVVWSAPNALWNLVHGEWSILCPTCFIRLANEAGCDTPSWRIQPAEYPAERSVIVQAVKPGDVVFIETTRNLSDDDVARLKQFVDGADLGVRVVVLWPDMKVAGK